MKIIHHILKTALTGAAALMMLTSAGCTQVSDELPDTFPDSVPEGTQITSPTSSAEETSSLPDIISRETEISQDTARTSPSASETAAVTTVSGTTLKETSEISETYISQETSAPETSSSESPVTTELPRITRVPIPTLPPADTENASETSADHTVQNTGEGYYPVNGYYPLNFKDQKAIWFSYLEYDRIMRGKSREEFTSALGDSFDNAAALGINTVYFQVRAYGDAYYRSALFPAADRLDGGYDPLETAVKLAHDKGLSIHAWINPMRLMTDTQMQGVSEDYPIGKWYRSESAKGTLIVNHSGRWYLSPAYSETVDLICDGVREIVTGYNVDGVQIDDYFYPTTDEGFDKAAYEASGTSLTLADWRRQTVSEMVKSIYDAVHSANPGAVFGISPSGNIASNRDAMYADTEKWLSEKGYCDYICPQLYYGFKNEAQPFETACSSWKNLIKCDDISLVIGLAAYKSGTEDKYAGTGRYEWQESTDILSRQCSTARAYSAGVAFFRYDSLFLPDPSVAPNVSAELEALRSSGLS